MACAHVGDSNPDIAGLGIIMAFSIQAGISIIVSAWAFLLAYENSMDAPRPTSIWAASVRGRHTHFWAGSVWGILAPVRAASAIGVAILRIMVLPASEVDVRFQILQSRVGQGIHMHFEERPYTYKKSACQLKLELIERVLALNSQIQAFNGIALLIAAISQQDRLALYHQHIVYDVVNFIGVSFSASLLNLWTNAESEGKSSWPKFFKWNTKRNSNVILAAIFFVLYLTYVILFAAALGNWDDERPGSCYNTDLIAHPDSSHPKVDKVYLGLTAYYMAGLLFMCVELGGPSYLLITNCRDGLERMITYTYGPSSLVDDSHETPSRLHRRLLLLLVEFFYLLCAVIWICRSMVIVMSLFQFPLHLYMAIALRSSNKADLVGDSEDSWGFGQVVALVLIVPVVMEMFDGWTEYKDVKTKWRLR